MAKKPKANNQNTTIRNVGIIFCTIILIAATALIWNNRSLAYAGTLDGQRMDTAHFNFFLSNWSEQLLGMGMNDPSFAADLAWGDLVDFYLVIRQADALPVSLTAEDMEEVDEIVGWFTEMWVLPNINRNIIREAGFTNASFRRFIEQLVLRDRLTEHIMSYVEFNEDDFQTGFADFLIEHAFDVTTVFVYYIEVETRSLADDILMQVMQGANFIQMMRDFSVAYDPELLFPDEDGVLIEHTNVLHTGLGMSFEHVMMAYGMAEGDISAVIELENGNYAIIEVAYIDDMDIAELEEIYRPQFEAEARRAYLDNQMLIWRENADITQNRRLFPEVQVQEIE